MGGFTSFEEIVGRVPEGIKCVEEYVVEDRHVAKHVGSGDVEVLSTPSMILFMEATALRCLQRYLPDNYTTVGYLVNVRHVNPAPKGAKVRVEVELTSREGRKLVFNVRALWGSVLIGEGVHERFVVDERKFLEKVRKVLQAS